MNTGDLLTRFRDEMNDTVEPYLWSDDLVFSYANEAQKKFAQLTDGIPDSSTAEVVELSVVPAQDSYPLHPTILKIRSAMRADTGRPVDVLNIEDMPTRGYYFDGIPGTVKALVIGMDADTARVWPMPNETVTLRLSTYRLPLVEIIDEQALEIPLQHHESLLLWMKSRGYLKQDAETYDRARADDFEQRFLAYAAAAKAEAARARHKPRTVAYGGI